MQSIMPEKTVASHSRTHEWRAEGEGLNPPQQKMTVTDVPEGIEVTATGETWGPVTKVFTWDDLFASVRNFANLEGKITFRDGQYVNVQKPILFQQITAPRFTCLNCGQDYGTELPFPENDPTDQCEEHSAAEGEGLILRDDTDTLPAYVVVFADANIRVLGYRWFFTAEARAAYRAENSHSWMSGMEYMTFPVPVREAGMTTLSDLQASLDDWWLQTKESMLLSYMADK